MKVLICGAGRVARHLLGHLGENWRVTLLDKEEARLLPQLSKFPCIERMMVGDASSPVILDEAGVEGFDYVLPLTDDDRVNLAASAYARSRGVRHILAIVNEQENRGEFRRMGVRMVLGSSILAQTVYHYLEDPRMKVTSLGAGQADVMEVEASHHLQLAGKPANTLMESRWRLAAILRDESLVFPSPRTVIEEDDRLIILGHHGLFKSVCNVLDCGHPRFPLEYGGVLLAALAPESDREAFLKECMHLAQNIRIDRVVVLCSGEERDLEEALGPWSHVVDLHVKRTRDDFFSAVQETAVKERCGLVVVEPPKISRFSFLPRTPLVSLSLSLPCPLLASRGTHPYQKVLVPFNGSPRAEQALKMAVDLARQLGAELAAIIVEEPEIIRGAGEEEDWMERVLERLRELAHIHKVDLEELFRRGNPVKEVAEAARGFDLMVVGSGPREKGLFSPHVGELLAREAPCSVLLT